MSSEAPHNHSQRADLAALRQVLSGTMALPDDAEYGLAQPWNVAVAVAPAAVIAAADATDIVETVRFAASAGFKVAVQATGHGAVPVGDEVLLVHTARLDECTVDVEQRTARIGAGVRWRQVLDAAGLHGLAPVAGSSPNVGVVGYLSGGGVGPLAATLGVSSDYVRSLDVVTGDGELRHVTPTEHADLFWGLRGGKATLGIITAVEIDLLPISTIYGGALYFDGADSAPVLHAWSTWSATLPEHATTSVALVQLPDLPVLPPAIAGKQTIVVRYASIADPTEAERVLDPLRAVATPVLASVGELPYTRIGEIHSDPSDPAPVQERHTLMSALTPEAVDALVQTAGPGSGSPLLVVELRRFGGAFARAPRDASAFSYRDAAYALHTIGLAVPPDSQAVTAHAERVIGAVGSCSTGRKLANFAASNDPDQIARAYDDETRDGLTAVADRYDPTHVLARG
jgi:hypothetical protein